MRHARRRRYPLRSRVRAQKERFDACVSHATPTVQSNFYSTRSRKTIRAKPSEDVCTVRNLATELVRSKQSTCTQAQPSYNRSTVSQPRHLYWRPRFSHQMCAGSDMKQLQRLSTPLEKAPGYKHETICTQINTKNTRALRALNLEKSGSSTNVL